ncbi:MAG: cytochrome c [Proteobacteria bacterium]|nr:cytochrome c [Pseudomonadota bacterium]
MKIRGMIRPLSAACLLAAFAAVPPAGFAATLVGNPQAGKSKVYTCHGCHGIPGYENAYPNYHVPRIVGQNEQYLVNALHEYQSGDRSHPTMAAQADSLSDQDIADIAAYLASFAKKP